jgi:hypothetical protein
VTGVELATPSFFELELDQINDLMTHFGLIFIGAAVITQSLNKKREEE